MKSTTQLTLDKLAAEGYRADIVERRKGPVTKDLFGIIDVLGIRGGETLAVQTTSRSNLSSRIRKIAESEAISDIRAAGWEVHVHGWDKKNGEVRCKVVNLS